MGVRERIADGVQHARMSRGWTQADLAERARLPLARIIDLESAVDPLDVDMLAIVANTLAVPVSSLVQYRRCAIR
jgi:transcriptional regulator with XRE-family HTH domain